MSRKHWIATAWLLALPLLSLGCVTWDEPLAAPPHGIPISLDDVPPSVIAPNELPEGTKAERYDGGAYRFEFPDGSIIVIGPDGKPSGGVI